MAFENTYTQNDTRPDSFYGATTTTTPVDPSVTDSLTGAERDAFEALSRIFNEYGLGSLAPAIAGFLKNGYSADTISIMLQDTPEYKQRFSANDTRRAKGLPALSPAEYLATERSYRQIMQAAGMPVGFYDSTDDFKRFLENDVSPQEIQSRVTAAADFVNQASPEAKQLFGQWYSKGDMIAYALDPEKAAPLVGKAFAATRIGANAQAHGLYTDQTYSEKLANAGFNEQQASQGFGIIQSTLANDQKLAALSGESITQTDLMNEAFFNDGSITQKREKLANQEAARFGGASAVSGSSLGTSRSGQI